jgi:hypothetical protein
MYIRKGFSPLVREGPMTDILMKKPRVEKSRDTVPLNLDICYLLVIKVFSEHVQ